MPLMHAQAFIFILHYFYVHTNNTVIPLSNKFRHYIKISRMFEISAFGINFSQLEGILNLKTIVCLCILVCLLEVWKGES